MKPQLQNIYSARQRRDGEFDRSSRMAGRYARSVRVANDLCHAFYIGGVILHGGFIRTRFQQMIADAAAARFP